MEQARGAGEASTPGSGSGSGRRGLDALLVALVLFAAHAAYGLAYELPVPRVHDEFAYLLCGETFAAGRVTNPPHALWEHFETFHVFHQPTYQSKYPPGQGAFLGLGFLLGHPALGVWLSLALAGGATCWMLAACLPRGWAVGGTLLFAANFELFQHWGQSYWGGALAMLGGALWFGGLLRMSRANGRPASGPAWIMGLGLLILANTRPLEGALTAVLTLPALLVRLRSLARAGSRAEVVRRVVLPLALAGLVIAAWSLYYNWRLTGQAFEMPHDHWRARDAASADVRAYRGSTERSLLGKLEILQRTYAGWLALAVPFLVLRLRSRLVLYAAFVVGVPALMSIFGTRAWPHYIAPVAGPIVFLTIEALRGLAGVRVRGAPLGALAAAALIALHLGGSLWGLATYVRNGPDPKWHRERHGMITALEEKGGAHLILVRYAPDHNVHQEWVFNAADIDGAAVVWARDQGAQRNAALLEYFRERRVWTVEADEWPPRLVAYEDSPP